LLFTKYFVQSLRHLYYFHYVFPERSLVSRYRCVLFVEA